MAKYLDFADIFAKKPANVLPEQTEVNKHTIELERGKQQPYGLFYSLKLVEFKIFKTYIKTNLANGFISASKLPTIAPILFVCKPNSSYCLYVNYQKLNNLIIKNGYPLPLITESLDWLNWAKQFTQLDLTSTYY